jgi:hypothetical protein
MGSEDVVTQTIEMDTQKDPQGRLGPLFGDYEVIVRDDPRLLHILAYAIKSAGQVIQESYIRATSVVQEAAKPNTSSMLQRGADLIRSGKVRLHTDKVKSNQSELVIQGPLSDNQNPKGDLAFRVKIPRDDFPVPIKITDIAVLVLSGNRVILTTEPQGKIDIERIVDGKTKEPTQTVLLQEEQAQLAKDIRSSYINYKNRRLLLVAGGATLAAVACGFEPVIGAGAEAKNNPTEAPSFLHEQLVPESRIPIDEVIIQKVPEEDISPGEIKFYPGAENFYYITHPSVPNFRVLVATGKSGLHIFAPENIIGTGNLRDDCINLSLHLLANAQAARDDLNVKDVSSPEITTIYMVPPSYDLPDGVAIPDNTIDRPHGENTYDPCLTQFYRVIVTLHRENYLYSIVTLLHEYAHLLGAVVYPLFEGAANAYAFAHAPKEYDPNLFQRLVSKFMCEKHIPDDTDSYSCFGFFIWLSSEIGMSLEKLLERFALSWDDPYCQMERGPDISDKIIQRALDDTIYAGYTFPEIFATWMASFLAIPGGSPLSLDKAGEMYKALKDINIDSLYMEKAVEQITTAPATTSRGTFGYYRIYAPYSTSTEYTIKLKFDETTIMIFTKDESGEIIPLESGDSVDPSQEIFWMNYGRNNFCVSDAHNACEQNVIHIEALEIK